MSNSDLTDQINGLMAQTQIAGELGINSKAMRPCVAAIASHREGLYDMSYACSILTVELLHLGISEEKVFHTLRAWNRKNIKPMKEAALRSTFRTAVRYQHKYYYSCANPYLEEFCVGTELCSYSRSGSTASRCDTRVFFTYQWQRILNPVARQIYLIALPEIERRRGFRPGSLLYVSQREIALYCGVMTKYVGKGLVKLKDHGLITYEPGKRHKWEGKASEVRRIFPIPRPPKRL
jgi:hypothetical protein